jgi:hypothetical protein
VLDEQQCSLAMIPHTDSKGRKPYTAQKIRQMKKEKKINFPFHHKQTCQFSHREIDLKKNFDTGLSFLISPSVYFIPLKN